MAPVPVARAFRFSIIAMTAALALSGCMRTAGPVAVAPQSNLDSIAYGETYAPAPVADASGGGAITALRTAFATRPHAAYAQIPVAEPVAVVAPVAYAEPVRYDASYHLD